MKKRDGPSLLIVLFFLVPGAVYLYMSFHPLRTLPPEDDLVLAEGVPTDIKDEDWRAGDMPGRRTVMFAVAGQRVFYDDGAPKYDEVLKAARAARPLQVWFSAQEWASFNSGPRCYRVYKLNIEEAPVLTYQDHQRDKAYSRKFSFVYGVAILIVALALALRGFVTRP